ncbi:MAG: 2-isopropylmalate synthase [Phycisphaeraceae bacterium]
MATPIRIFDTTLRDGEQSPGASLNHEEKIEIARQLESLGVDVIEAGFPITSQGDFEAVKAIGKDLAQTTVCGLARCVDRDIERAAEALRAAYKPRIHVFCATSKIHLDHKFKKPFEAIVEMSVKGVARAKSYVDDVEFSPEDGSRTSIDDLVTITKAVIDAGAMTINIPDTVGYSTPAEYGAIFRQLHERLPEIEAKGVVLSSHCHNDLGLAVANSLSAMENGAKQIECTINGIGERAGNAALEEVAMALRARPQSTYHGLDTTRLCAVSQLVESVTGSAVPPNKAIVGANAFAHEAGIHQHGVLSHRGTYEILRAEDVGAAPAQIVLGKHSGKHAVRARLKALGIPASDEDTQRIFHGIKRVAEAGAEVTDVILRELAQEGNRDVPTLDWASCARFRA